jgi:hypothetical protein
MSSLSSSLCCLSCSISSLYSSLPDTMQKLSVCPEAGDLHLRIFPRNFVIEMAPVGYSMAWWKLILEKNLKLKNSRETSFNCCLFMGAVKTCGDYV